MMLLFKALQLIKTKSNSRSTFYSNRIVGMKKHISKKLYKLKNISFLKLGSRWFYLIAAKEKSNFSEK